MFKKALIATASLSLLAAPAIAGDYKYSKKTIVEKAVATDDLSTLVAAVKAADLVETLNGEGPFTVFAPTNKAFADIQPTVETLLMPENKAALQGVLTYHVIAGKVKSKDIVNMIEKEGGPITVETVAGGTLEVSLDGENVKIEDANGGVATVSAADIKAKNGVVHIIDAVLVPSM